MINCILISLVIYIITCCVLFYIDWCFYYDEDRNIQTVLEYMNWIEFVPFINTFLACIMIGFFSIVFICNYISDFLRFIKEIIAKIFS